MSTAIGTSNNSAAYKPQVTSAGGSQLTTQQKLSGLFQQIDTTGSGRITKAQFEHAFDKLTLPASVKEMGKEDVYKNLDPSGSGTVTKQDFIQGMAPLMTQKASANKAKESTIEAKPATAPKVPEKTMASQYVPGDMPPSSEGWAVGYMINTTA